MPDWLFVDGSSLIFRAFFAVPQAVRAPDGRSVNAVRGFMDTMARVLPARRPVRLAVASDEDWRPAWRVELLPSYKAHRVAEPIPPDLDRQMPHIHRVLAAIGVDFVGAPDFEAEDVIASWVSQVDGTVEILSGDRDLFGLVDGSRVRVLYPEKGGLAEVDDAEVERRYGVPAGSYSDFAVLRGDPSDGLPGLSGVGPKRAADLVRHYGGVEGLLAERRLSSSDADYLRRALQVVQPAAGAIPLPEGRRAAYPADHDDLAAATEELGLGSSPGRLVDALRGLPDAG
ncbi:MAG TPA: 5'-3' exonuclease [Candidatus Binatia bacterium]|jgi:5'-3' exonuclease|nr:5'-3' exonuclease [Candidatus Binatia bacterium]